MLGTTALTNLTSDDVAIGGSFACQLANLGIGLFIDIVKTSVTSLVRDLICNSCPCQ